ncbi:ribosome biogenesis GTPase YlqF [Limnohabitans sp. Rim11]|uniref:ribosome biogenesis GTPase YlqF n=1 Tax=Limnohabitans sp. Rim11 TaxID=1100719 RepID=UPI000B7F4FE2|nr:ribosome biogenesis GTPase YlqF [Limnohabitans sp. Rim11]
MAIQWFPGHMHLTRKAIEERIKDIDVVIEMLDARLPGSSANPMLAQLIQGKPGLKILSKQDLADPVQTQSWLAHYNAMTNVKAIGLDTSMVSPAKALIEACHQLAPNRGGMAKPMRVLICGIPNVGKSTLINTLKGKKAAKTGDEAGVTKIEQRITLADDFYLYDTPGVLWPRIIVEKSGYNLAASGAIGVNAFDDEEVALELLNYLIEHYPGVITARYKIENVSEHTDETLLEAVARYRGAIQSGGRVNTTKAAEIVIHDFRSAALGRLTLETPDQFAAWLASGLKADADRAAKKEALNKEKKKSRKTKS